MDSKTYYEFGYEVFGSALLGFSRWLEQSFQKKQYRKIFFLARDGYLMESAFRLRKSAETYETEYVYFSRKSIRQALFWKCGSYEETLKYMPGSRFLSLGAILDFYGFSIGEQEELIKEFQLDSKKDYVGSELKENPVIAELFEKIKGRILTNSKKQYEILIQYFKQIGMQGTCAIVDIGWLGNMQFYLEEFIRISQLEVDLDGYYFGIQPTTKISGKAYGYMFSPEDMHLRKHVLCFFGICERLFQSTEGSTKGYALQGDRVVPIKDKYEYAQDETLAEYIVAMQKGALDFVEQNPDCVKKDKELVSKFLRFGKSPTLKQLKLFRGFYNTDGTKLYYLPQKSVFMFRMGELLHGLSNSTWKTGYMKSLCKIPFPYYWIYCLVRK